MRFITLLASHPEAAGCQVNHVAADGDSLIVLTALGVADAGGAPILIGDDKPSHNVDCPVRSREILY